MPSLSLSSLNPVLLAFNLLLLVALVIRNKSATQSRARGQEKRPPADLKLFDTHRAILESAGDGIYGVDSQGVVTFANPAAGRITGWEAHELIGKPQHEGVGGAVFPLETCSIFSALLDGDIHHRDDEVFWRRNGTSFPVEYTSTPLREDGALVGAVVVFQDITERKEQEFEERNRQRELELRVQGRTHELQQANLQLSAVLEAASLVTVIAITPANKITIFNSGAERMLGYNAKEMLGADLASLHLPEEIESRRGELSRQFGERIQGPNVFTELARRGKPEVAEWTLVRKDGARLLVSLGMTALRDQQGKITGFLGIAIDISESKRAEEAQELAKVAAESANRAKSDFLAAMSHEIRTPMNGILGMAELLLNSGLDPRQRKRAETLRDSAQALLAVLNDILDFSKIEAGKLDLEVADLNLRVVVEGVADLMAVKAQEKGLELTCFIEPDVPTGLCGDPSRLRQVLVNLVGNAVKFTQKGEVILRVRQAGSEDAPAVRFEIKDSGIGVPAEKQHLLFERFSQADASTARHYGGTGLGLSIVRGLVEMMGGEIGFESEHGKGSTFWFTAALPKQATAQRPRALSLAGKRVLVVDDNATSRSLILELLSYWGCQGEEAPTARAALDRLNGSKMPAFDAIIVDLDMPVYGGDRLGASIRQDARWAATPLVLLTPLNQTNGPEYWSTHGFTACVMKPVKQGELGAALATVLGYGPAPTVPANQSAVGKGAKREARAHFRLLLVEDNVVNQEVALGILENLGYATDVVSSGGSALTNLRGIPYSALLTDCQMPEMDGYELCRLVRNSSTDVLDHQIPIIAMTAHALAGDREKCLIAGMDDYVTKPIQSAVLEEVLDRWTTGRVVSFSQTAAPPAPSAPQTSPNPFDQDDLIERLMGNEDLARRVVGRFIDDMPQQLLALADAVNRSDVQATVLAAHSIKGAAANVGGVPIRDIASQLEELGGTGDFLAATKALGGLSESFDSLKPVLQRFCVRD